MPVPARIGGPFSPVTIYDAPEVLLNQAVSGELSAGTLKATFAAPDNLTPSERQTVGDRLAAAAGGSNVARALAGVVTNPWTWLLFLSAPIGEKPVGDIFKLAERYAPWATENAGLLTTLGTSSTSQVLRGTRSARAADQVLLAQHEFLSTPEYSALQKGLGEVYAKNGLGVSDGLNWHVYADGSPQQQAAKEIAVSLHAALAGADRTVTREASVLDAETKVPKLVTTAQDPLVTTDPLQVLQKYGADGLVAQTRAAYKAAATKVFSDPDAVLRLYRNLSRSDPSGFSTARDVAGRAMVKTLLGDTADDILKGNTSLEEFKGLIQDHVINPILRDENYVPANVLEAFVGDVRAPKRLADDAKVAATLRAGNSVTPRGPVAPIYHPDDLQAMKDVLGATPELDTKLQQALAVQRDSGEKGVAVRFNRIRPDDATGRYFDSMGRTYGLFVKPINESVLEVDRALAGKLESPFAATNPELATHGESITGTQAPVTKTLNEVIGTADEPAGGFTNADAIYADFATFKSQWARNTISKVLVPRLSGQITLQSAAKMAAINDAKGIAESFLGTDAAKAIEGSSTFGAKFIGGMRKVAQSTEESFGEGEKLQRFVLNTLYSSHLGLNISSALLNLTQPFLYAGSFGGYKNVLRAYGDAFSEFGAYWGKRIEQGFAPLTAFERGALIRQTHKYANYAGQDLLEVAGDSIENLEGKLFHSLVKENSIRSLGGRLAFEYPLALFGQAEIINRNVAAHVAGYALDAQQAAGAAVSDFTRIDNIKSFVRETQYGGSWLNTPQAFLPEAAALGVPTGRLLANPLVRQFLSFPLRSFTTLAYTAPRLAGRSGLEGIVGAVRDASRGLAVSAIGYEVAKGLFNADISRAGFAAAATDIIPGFSQGRFDFRDGPIPTPPIIDIPFQIIKGIATDDTALIQRNLPRLVPGGVALSRALGAAPSLGALSFVGQKQYADWGHLTPDGQVPIYKSDGSLTGFQNPTSTILRGLGISINSQDEESRLTGYLVAQRQQIADARREYLRRVTGGDMDGAEQAAKAFEGRFKVPLTVTRSQMQAFQTSLNTPRVDKVLNSFPAEVRAQYASLRPGTPPPPVDRGSMPPAFTPNLIRATDSANGVVDGGDIQGRLVRSLSL